MNHVYIRRNLTFMLVILLSHVGLSQSKNSFWTSSDSKKVEASNIVFYKAIPQKSTILTLDTEGLKNALEEAPSRDLNSNKTSNLIIDFPNADGVMESFRIMEASNMAPELQTMFPNIRSYVGIGINNPKAIIRFSMSSEKGFSSMVLSDKKTVFTEPYSNDLSTYITFINLPTDPNDDNFLCETEYFKQENNISDEDYIALKNADDGQLRTYRLALACTGEYATFHGGTQASVMAAMNTTMTRVNGVFERDLAVTMVMVPNNNLLIYLNAGTDPYTNNNGGTMLGQNQTTCDNIIGSTNYDIGHVFSTGGGGVAYLNSPCNPNLKAGGVTGLGTPVGDAFDIDYVAHEMGHQYGGNHTQNNSCQRSNNSVEPGSASTIMGYAGICAPNVQNNSDDYFHGENIKEMWLNISAGTSSNCGTLSATNNAAPVISAGLDYAIPRSTAFVLSGTAIDGNTAAANLTYCWEQRDTAPAPMPPVSTSTGGPAFRSLDPTGTPVRYMPAFNTVLSGSLASTWEVVPSVGRTMSFLFTVRDNEMNGGATQSDIMTVNVQGGTPFTISTPPTWAQNSTQTVNWALGESNIAPISCQAVNILFAEDGVNFTTTLASAVANTGSATITVPNVSNSTAAKLLIEADDNIFYAISDAFSINSSADFSISNTSGNLSTCNIDTVTYSFNYVTSNGFSEPVTLSATGAPAGATVTFNPSTPLTGDGVFTMQVSNLLNANAGDYTMTVTGSASFSRTATADLTITDGVCDSVANVTYQTSTTGVVINDGTADILSNLNTGKPSGYTNYSGIAAVSVPDMVQGDVYDLSVYANTDGDYTCVTTVWVDWNQNCAFEATEEYDLGITDNVVNGLTANSPLGVIVPANAVLGTTTMRVVTKYNVASGACENAHDAEVEDYDVNVLTSLSVDEFSINGLSVYPNPNNGTFNISFNSADNDKVNVQVFDIRGRAIFRNVFSNTGEFNETINLRNAQSGMYLLNVTYGSRTITKKIIIE